MTLPKPVSLTLVLTVVFWVYMFGQQVYLVWYSFAVGSDHPTVNSFAHRYAITSSLVLLTFVAFAAALSACVYMFRSPWAAAALAVLSAFAVWRYFFAGTSIYFRPPLGDGSWSQALAGYYRLHANALIRHILQSVVLFTLLILWPLCAARLRHVHERSA